jgi:hypothetical protein
MAQGKDLDQASLLVDWVVRQDWAIDSFRTRALLRIVLPMRGKRTSKS